ELATMGAPGVLAHLRAANLLFHGFDVRIFQQLFRDASAESPHFPERRSRRGGNLEHKMAFAKFRKKFTAKKRQRRQRAEEQRERQADDGPRFPARLFQHSSMNGFQAAQVSRFLVWPGARKHDETE